MIRAVRCSYHAVAMYSLDRISFHPVYASYSTLVSFSYRSYKIRPLTRSYQPGLLLPQPRLQRSDVGALHLGPNPRLLHHPRRYNQHLCELHADGFFRVDGIW